jgi:hypothetical protein
LTGKIFTRLLSKKELILSVIGQNILVNVSPEMNIPFLGAIPINLVARKMADEGKPIIIEKCNADMSIVIFQIITRVKEIISV